MSTPKRIQRKRVKGWRMPANTISVTRPGRFGNPFVIGDDYEDKDFNEVEVTRENCLAFFRSYAEGRLKEDPAWLEPLRGKDVACFCKLESNCHGDILLELAQA